MAAIFKSLAPNDYTITPFPAYYSYSYTYLSGSAGNSEDVQLLFGSKFLTSSGISRAASDQQELFDSVMQIFYSQIPTALYGLTSASYTPSSSVYVITVTQDLYGNTILPGTFSITVGTSSSIDDSNGKLIVSESGTGSVIGQIFYDKGIAVIKPTSSISGRLTRNGLYIPSASSLNINFTSSVQLYEHAIQVKMNPIEFLYSLNNPTSISVLADGIRAVDKMRSKTLLPYITEIGLYNRYNELLAVAKISNPIQRTTDSNQTVIIKFDT